jgi:hypothetical protein
LQAPEQLPGFAYPRTKAAKSAMGVESFRTAILERASLDIDAGVDESLRVTGNGKFYTRSNMSTPR